MITAVPFDADCFGATVAYHTTAIDAVPTPDTACSKTHPTAVICVLYRWRLRATVVWYVSAGGRHWRLPHFRYYWSFFLWPSIHLAWHRIGDVIRTTGLYSLMVFATAGRRVNLSVHFTTHTDCWSWWFYIHLRWHHQYRQVILRRWPRWLAGDLWWYVFRPPIHSLIRPFGIFILCWYRWWWLMRLRWKAMQFCICSFHPFAVMGYFVHSPRTTVPRHDPGIPRYDSRCSHTGRATTFPPPAFTWFVPVTRTPWPVFHTFTVPDVGYLLPVPTVGPFERYTLYGR